MFEQKRFLPVIPLLALLLACEDPLDLGDPAFVGVIQSVRVEPERIRFIAKMNEQGACSDLVDVSVLDRTVIVVEQPDGSLRNGWRGDLAVGTRVRVWHERWIRPACTPQVGGVRIEIPQQEPGQ